MIVFAFPAVILGTLLLELERAFDWPFFDRGSAAATRCSGSTCSGSSATPRSTSSSCRRPGLVSMIVPTMARHAAGRLPRSSSLALVATGFVSFGAVGRTTCSPPACRRSGARAVLSAAEHGGRGADRHPGVRLDRHHGGGTGALRSHAASLFVLGFLFTFVLGGLTGVMVAVVPFDWQVHDTYFIVAHLHYVLIGGMVFPLFAASSTTGCRW